MNKKIIFASLVLGSIASDVMYGSEYEPYLEHNLEYRKRFDELQNHYKSKKNETKKKELLKFMLLYIMEERVDLLEEMRDDFIELFPQGFHEIDANWFHTVYLNPQEYVHLTFDEAWKKLLHVVHKRSQGDRTEFNELVNEEKLLEAIETNDCKKLDEQRNTYIAYRARFGEHFLSNKDESWFRKRKLNKSNYVNQSPDVAWARLLDTVCKREKGLPDNEYI